MQFIVIPTRAASILRDALICEIGRPAGQAEQHSTNAHDAKHIEALRAAVSEIKAISAALEEIGWHEPPHTHWRKHRRASRTMIDLDHHYNAILTALHSQLEVEHDFMNDQRNHRGGRKQYRSAKRNAKTIEKLLRANGLPVSPHSQSRPAGA